MDCAQPKLGGEDASVCPEEKTSALVKGIGKVKFYGLMFSLLGFGLACSLSPLAFLFLPFGMSILSLHFRNIAFNVVGSY